MIDKTQGEKIKIQNIIFSLETCNAVQENNDTVQSKSN